MSFLSLVQTQRSEPEAGESSQSVVPRSGESKNSGPAVAVTEEVGRVWQGVRDGPPLGMESREVQTLGKWTASHSAPHTKTAHNRTPRQHCHTHSLSAQVPHTQQGHSHRTHDSGAQPERSASV